MYGLSAEDIYKFIYISPWIGKHMLWMYKPDGIMYEPIYLPKIPLIIALPIFRSRPALEVGIPVLRANCCFA